MSLVTFGYYEPIRDLLNYFLTNYGRQHISIIIAIATPTSAFRSRIPYLLLFAI